MTVWVSKDGRITPIIQMDDDHLVNTILYMDRQYKEVKEAKRIFFGVINARVKMMLAEAKKRALMPRIWRERGDTREMVKATHEIHARIAIYPKDK